MMMYYEGKSLVTSDRRKQVLKDIISFGDERVYLKNSHITGAHFPQVNILVQNLVAKSHRIQKIPFSVPWNFCYIEHLVNLHHLPLTSWREVQALRIQANIISVVIFSIQPDVTLPGVAHMCELCQGHSEVFENLKNLNSVTACQ